MLFPDPATPKSALVSPYGELERNTAQYLIVFKRKIHIFEDNRRAAVRLHRIGRTRRMLDVDIPSGKRAVRSTAW